jgi:mycothiol system anti-sigma-R factor
MSCRELDAFLHPYLDGEFDAGERTEFEHHLSTCAPCAAAVAQERALRQKVREAMSRAPAAPAQLRASIQQGLGRTQRQLTLGLWMRAGGWMAAAAAMVGGVVFYSRQDSGRRYLE